MKKTYQKPKFESRDNLGRVTADPIPLPSNFIDGPSEQ